MQTQRIHKNKSQELYDSLILSGEDARAAWFLSSRYEGSGKWLMSGMACGKYYGAFRFQENEFLDALRLRVLMNPIPTDHTLGFRSVCACCHTVNVGDEPLHALDCGRSGAFYQKRRHDLVRDLLAKHIAQSSRCTNVRVETPVGNGAILDVDPNNPNIVRTADITALWTNRNVPLFVDVTIVDPSAPTYRNAAHDYSSLHIAGGAAAQRAAEKINKYRAIGIQVTPFAMEATGRVGEAAQRLLNDFSTLNQPVPRTVLAKMRIIIQRYNSRLIAKLRRHMLSDSHLLQQL